jgi:hypothetical protein
MTDIVVRLRDWASTICTVRSSLPEGSKSKLARDAADEIERLRAELKDAKARNTMYLSKIQEYEVREI